VGGWGYRINEGKKVNRTAKGIGLRRKGSSRDVKKRGIEKGGGHE